MKTRINRSKVFALIALSLMVVLVGLSASTRRVQAISSFSFSSGMAGLAPGQTARIGVVNTGNEDVQVTLSILDDEGKVQSLCDQIVAPGKAHFDDFKHPGGINRLELRGVVIVREAAARDAKTVLPALQFFDDETGKTTLILGAADWAGPVIR